jgi:hypothetical protein
MNGIVGTAPPGAMYVRALYDYEADDRTSLSFHEGDVIQVITQLDSGWWDGVINGVRGWFPSNYCQAITSPDDLHMHGLNGQFDQDDDLDDGEIYDDSFDPDDESESEGFPGLPLEGSDIADKSRADFWIPQATADGRLFYYNMMTGDRSMELPLESPISANETGPRDRMNVNIPEKTRPPAEMLARGLTQDEDEDSTTSASEAEGDSVMLNSRRSMVRLFALRNLYLRLSLLIFLSYRNHDPVCPSAQMLCHHQHRWIPSMESLRGVDQGTTRFQAPISCRAKLPTLRLQPRSQARHTMFPQPLLFPGPSLMMARQLL